MPSLLWKKLSGVGNGKERNSLNSDNGNFIKLSNRMDISIVLMKYIANGAKINSTPRVKITPLMKPLIKENCPKLGAVYVSRHLMPK